MKEGSRQFERTSDTISAIREAAASLFANRGFDQTGIRDIAAAARVSPAIVIRHFGSKEHLFLETVDIATPLRALLNHPVDTLGRHVVRRVLEGRNSGVQIFGTTVRATSRPDIRHRFGELLRESLAEQIAERLPNEDSSLRAHLFTAQLIGLLSALSVYDDQLLREGHEAEIVARYGDSMQRVLTG